MPGAPDYDRTLDSLVNDIGEAIYSVGVDEAVEHEEDARETPGRPYLRLSYQGSTFVVTAHRGDVPPTVERDLLRRILAAGLLTIENAGATLALGAEADPDPSLALTVDEVALVLALDAQAAG